MDTIKQYLRFVKPYFWQIVATVLIGILKFAIPLLIPLILKYVIDTIIEGDMSQSDQLSHLFWLMGTAFAIFIVLRPPVEFFRQYLAQMTASKILYDLRDRLFDHLQRLSLKYYANTKTGEVISRTIHDVEQTKEFVVTGLMNVWLDFVTILIAIVIMFTMDVKLTLVSIILFPLYGFSVKYFYAKLRRLTRERSQALAEVQGHLHERIQGISVTRSFALEDYEQEQFDKRNTNFLTRAIRHANWNAKTFAMTNTITDLAPLLVIAFAGYQVIMGNLTVGTMVAFASYMERVYSPLRRLINASTQLTQSIASIDRVFELMNEKYDVEDELDAKVLEDVQGRIDMENISFAYQKDEPNVINGVNLHVNKGETIALVGMSGGGKSTLVSLIPRFYDVLNGSIKIDGTDVREVTQRSLRDHIGMVLQDNILFSESIAMNIRMGNPDATDEEVIEAAKAANAHGFIEDLPEKYDTLVGERGVKLSGGQQQRIAIARVFLKNPPILIFDEATSALDLESENTIQNAMVRLAEQRTTFIVAHRLATITHADRIVVVEHGQITESGTHQELLANQGSYYDLYQVQDFDNTGA
ncbi:MAG TPA: ABC transporter ATP-binding protein [Pseudogracilibacillus sp.]|nr:ABC transporter ATP-binding protein [Pseudogracilibacillus sp.]